MTKKTSKKGVKIDRKKSEAIMSKELSEAFDEFRDMMKALVNSEQIKLTRIFFADWKRKNPGAKEIPGVVKAYADITASHGIARMLSQIEEGVWKHEGEITDLLASHVPPTVMFSTHPGEV